MRITTLFVAIALLAGSILPAMALETAWFSDGHSALTNWGNNPPNPVVNLTYPQFDEGALYTLTRIDWDMRGECGANAYLENLSGTPANVDVDIWATISWYKPDSTLFDTMVPLVNTGVLSMAAFDGNINYLGPSGARVMGLSTVLNSSGFMTSGAAFDMFKGVGSVNTAADALGNFNAKGNSNLAQIYQTGAVLTGRIKYTYRLRDEIPEPGTASLMLAGLAAVGLVRRRRRAA